MRPPQSRNTGSASPSAGSPPRIVTSGFASSPALGIPAITAGMIVIRNLQITADWTGSDQQRLNTNAVSLGPFSVAGATFNGQTLTRPGMQASAWICQVPPKLPPG